MHISSLPLLLLLILPVISSSHPQLQIRQPSANSRESINNEEISLAAKFIKKRQTQNLNVEEFLPCKGPSGRDGHCRHLKDCLIPEFTENYSQNIEYFCVIRKRNEFYAGVCCPDDAELSGTTNAPETTSYEINGKTVKPEESRFCGLNGRKVSRDGDNNPAEYNNWPWMVALMRYKSFKKTLVHFCGAVLINNWHVLSAAHCFNTMKPEDTTVRLGAYDFKNTTEFPYTDYKVVAGKVHRDYDKATNENDIILLKLARPVQFNKMIRPTCMPKLENPADFINKTATVAGWGATSFGGPASSRLLNVDVPIWDHETCKAQYTQPIPDTAVCASGYEGGKDACQGDSGGPLFKQRKDGRWTTIGIVSWGIGCAQKGRPGIYTRVFSFLAWITKAQAELA